MDGSSVGRVHYPALPTRDGLRALVDAFYCKLIPGLRLKMSILVCEFIKPQSRNHQLEGKDCVAPRPTFRACQTNPAKVGVWDCETSLRIGADELAVGEVGHAERETSRVSRHSLKRSTSISSRPPLIERLKHADSPSPGADRAIGHPDRPSLGRSLLRRTVSDRHAYRLAGILGILGIGFPPTTTLSAQSSVSGETPQNPMSYPWRT